MFAYTHYFIVLNKAYQDLALTSDGSICKFTKVPASRPTTQTPQTQAFKVSFFFNLTFFLPSFLPYALLSLASLYLYSPAK